MEPLIDSDSAIDNAPPWDRAGYNMSNWLNDCKRHCRFVAVYSKPGVYWIQVEVTWAYNHPGPSNTSYYIRMAEPEAFLQCYLHSILKVLAKMFPVETEKPSGTNCSLFQASWCIMRCQLTDGSESARQGLQSWSSIKCNLRARTSSRLERDV